MAEALKVLGQSSPAAVTNTTLYTSPSGGTAAGSVISTITVCNRDAAAQAQFRIAVRPAGAAIANAHYLYYDAFLGPNSTVAITLGITLAPTDVVTVFASTANLSFSAFGTEVS